MYLGLPFSAKYKQKSVWWPLVDKFRDRLALWNRKYHLQNQPLLLYLSSSCLFSSCQLQLLKSWKGLLGIFFGVRRRRKRSIIEWDVIFLPLELGGLGIKRFWDMIVALLGKWLWKFGCGSFSLWYRVIKDKFGLFGGGWFSKKGYNAHGCSVWQGIMGMKTWFTRNISLLLGDGNKISFWFDTWAHQKSLRELFPLLFKKSRKKREWWAQLWKGSLIGVCTRAVDFLRRNFRGVVPLFLYWHLFLWLTDLIHGLGGLAVQGIPLRRLRSCWV